MRGITPDQVEAALRAEEAIIARSKARQAAWIGIADAMQLPTADGARSMREWIAGRLDLSSETATRLTTTARRLAACPDVAQELAEGDITFDRAEAMARIPAEKHEERLRGVDIQGLRRIAAHYRRVTRADDHEAHVRQHLALQPNLDESEWDVWGKLDGYGGAVVHKVLTEEADRVQDLPDEARPGIGYRRAAALVNICEGSRPRNVTTPLITVFVDEENAETESGTTVGPAILDKVACLGGLELVRASKGTPLSVGRRSRIVPNRLKRFILHRDGGCTADGCTSRHRLEPHHIHPWSEGGPTDVGNLTTLCCHMNSNGPRSSGKRRPFEYM